MWQNKEGFPGNIFKLNGLEGEGLYEIDLSLKSAELIYNPATDISFEWGGVEYCFECPQCAELFDTIYCENCLPKFAFAMRSCWECNTGHEHLKREKGLFWCLECDRYYEEGVFL
jgi:hypothetical protein